MNIYYFTPYSIMKNLGESYNKTMSLVPEGDAGCLMDGDSCFLTSDWGHIIHEYANEHPNAVLTCYLNRIHPMAKGQLHPEMNSTSVLECVHYANKIKNDRTVTPITGSVSGTLLVVPKHIWQRFPFVETNHYRPGETNILGVDNAFTNAIRAAGIPILRMNGMLLYHQYRILSNGQDKTHLL